VAECIIKPFSALDSSTILLFCDDMIRYDTVYIYVRSKADEMTRLV